MVETNKPSAAKPSIRKPRPSPKGTGKDTGCKHSSIIWPKDVWEALQREVHILDKAGNIIGDKKGMSINSVAVGAVREKFGLPNPEYTAPTNQKSKSDKISKPNLEIPEPPLSNPDPSTLAFSKIVITSKH